MSIPTLEFWFDFASTYSYITAMQIETRCEAARIPLAWRPFQLGPIFALQGWNTSPFVVNPIRGAYMWRDMERLTTKLGLPWKRPSVFPRVGTLAARVAAVHAETPWIPAFVRACFTATFGDDADLNNPATLVPILASLGLDARAVLAEATASAKRARLRENTERAIRLGIFGAPTCVVGDEIFWGEETLDDAIAWAAAVLEDSKRMLV